MLTERVIHCEKTTTAQHCGGNKNRHDLQQHDICHDGMPIAKQHIKKSDHRCIHHGQAFRNVLPPCVDLVQIVDDAGNIQKNKQRKKRKEE